MIAAQLPEIAPGVSGFIEDGAVLRIGLVIAKRRGSGDVGRWLDTLPADRPVRVSNVMSKRLAGMLTRRGFRPDGWDYARG